MKKITFLMLHLNYGGIEKQVTTLANNLAGKYDVEIISLYDLLNGKSFYDLNEKIKIKFIYPSGPIRKSELLSNLKKFKIITFLKNFIFDIKVIYTKFFGLKNIIKNLNSDVIISSRIEFSKQIKKRKECITIAQEHTYIDNKKYIKKVKKSFKGIDYLVVMTKKAKEKYDLWLKDIKEKPEVVVIPNMIKENKEKQVSTLNNNQIISVGRLEAVKDFYTLILIFSILVKKYPKLTLKIIGEGSQRDEIKKLIKECNLQKNVMLTGKLKEDEINKELLKSDIFVLTSKSESFSLVLCEAMNYGLPCVAFDVDVGPREIIQNDINGFLIKDRNLDLMEKKIDELLSNKTLRNKLGKGAYNNARKFYSSNLLSKWEQYFNR